MDIARRLNESTPSSVTDRSLIVDLREYLESAAQQVLSDWGPQIVADDLPLRISKGRLADLARCQRLAVASARWQGGDDKDVGEPLLRGVALDYFVAHQLSLGRVRDPLNDLRSMLCVEGEWELVEYLDGIEDERTTAMCDLLAAQVARAWSGVEPAWLPRTQVPASLWLAEGRIACSGRLDVELGGPLSGLPGVIIESKSGQARPEHADELYFYALLVALRDGEAPSMVARWYPGAPLVELLVSSDVLESAAVRLADSMAIWAELTAGPAASVETPGVHCQFCPDARVCPSFAVDISTGEGNRG